MLRAVKTTRDRADLFRDFKEAIELTDKILRQNDPQHYPFETLAQIARNYDALGQYLDSQLKALIDQRLHTLINYAQKRIGVLPSGYQKDEAQSALDSISQ
jgi:CO dehydrogenase/acetyl-CoA synthase beta subunit